jgi:hypothetical protein
VRETPRSIEKSSNAGITPAAVKVVIMAWKATRKRLIFFFQEGQLSGSAGSMEGRGVRSVVPCRAIKYSLC